MTEDPNNATGAGVRPRRQLALWGLAAWTIFVALALWWLLTSGKNAGTATWIVGDSAHQTSGERVANWFKLLHINFHRVYPWILFGPYVVFLTRFFTLERGRLARGLAVHLIACGGFVAASQAITPRLSVTGARIMIMSSGRTVNGSSTNESGPFPSRDESNTFEVHELVVSSDGSGAQAQLFRHTVSNADGGMPTNAFRARRGMGGGGGSFSGVAALPPVPGGGLATGRPFSILMDLLAYGAMVGLAHSALFYGRYRERENRTLLLESNLATARLNALQAQLQPHFLFNSLNAVAALLRRDPRAAEATLVSLSELLRMALSQSERQEVTLREELEFVGRYLEIQQTRFGDKLRVEQNISAETLECLTPSLLLQPLVENAIRHGLEPSEKPGLIRLTACRREERLVLSVEDDGVGFPGENTAAGQSGTGIGLKNLRERLKTLYGGAQKLELTSKPEGGVSVVVEIPWRTVKATESGPASRPS